MVSRNNVVDGVESVIKIVEDERHANKRRLAFLKMEVMEKTGVYGEATAMK